MTDAGLCFRCRKPSIRSPKGWTCPHCGSEREHYAGLDAKKELPDGYWRRGGNTGPDRSR